MPIYEYKCKKCNHEFELLLYSGEIPLCPKCNSKDLTKKISSFCTSSGENKNDSYLRGSSSNSGCGSCSGKSCSTCS